MKAQVKVGPHIILDVEAAKQKDLFKAMSSAYEVFGEKCCGLCGSAEIKPIWRTVTKMNGKRPETFEYPEWRCSKCPGRLSMGTINDDTGTLFPIRKLNPETGLPATKEEKEKGQDGKYGQHNGWYKFTGKPNEG